MNFVKALAGAVALLGCSSALAQEGDMQWPELPSSGFVSGRAATVDDAKAGNAVFSMNGSGQAIQVSIPQYVYWADERGAKHPMILVQAEKAPDGTQIVGLRDFKGGETVATMPEIQLLGPKKPE